MFYDRSASEYLYKSSYKRLFSQRIPLHAARIRNAHWQSGTNTAVNINLDGGRRLVKIHFAASAKEESGYEQTLQDRFYLIKTRTVATREKHLSTDFHLYHLCTVLFYDITVLIDQFPNVDVVYAQLFVYTLCT